MSSSTYGLVEIVSIICVSCCGTASTERIQPKSAATATISRIPAEERMVS